VKRTAAGADRGVAGHPEQPPGGGTLSHHTRLAGEDCEGGLERVLRRVVVGRMNRPAHRPHHVGVSADEQFERHRVGVGRVPPEQFGVRHGISAGEGDRERAEERTVGHPIIDGLKPLDFKIRTAGGGPLIVHLFLRRLQLIAHFAQIDERISRKRRQNHAQHDRNQLWPADQRLLGCREPRMPFD